MFGVAYLGLNPAQTLKWANIAGSLDASNSNVPMPYSATISISFTNSSSGALYYVKNGAAPVQYSTPFAVSAGDALHWEAQTKGTFSSVVTVYRNGGATLIDTFNVTLS